MLSQEGARRDKDVPFKICGLSLLLMWIQKEYARKTFSTYFVLLRLDLKVRVFTHITDYLSPWRSDSTSFSLFLPLADLKWKEDFKMDKEIKKKKKKINRCSVSHGQIICAFCVFEQFHNSVNGGKLIILQMSFVHKNAKQLCPVECILLCG